MDEYVLAINSAGEVIGCDRCDSEAPTTSMLGADLSHRRESDPDRYFQMCKFCIETELGTVISYSRQHTHGEVALARGLCQALNLVYWDGKEVPRAVHE